ncbi:MAG: hypothetical protein QM811_20745 [Pirellulales bacterium]
MRLFERGQNPHAGRFARAVRADVAEDAARLDGERDVVDRVRAPVEAVQAAKFDGGRHNVKRT